MKKVMVFGTFDFFHIGHLHFLQQAKRLGEYLIVVIARDKTSAKVKKQQPIHTEKERKQLLEQIKLVDEVALGSRDAKYRVIAEKKPDIIALGYDQAAFVEALPDFIKTNKLKTKIVRLKPHQPTRLKSSLKKQQTNVFGI